MVGDNGILFPALIPAPPFGWHVQHFQPPYRRQFLVIDYWSGRAIEATHGLIPGCIFYGRADAALVYGRADYAIVYGNPCAC
jgi:hypothetical protein